MNHHVMGDTWIAGVNPWRHDSAAALLRNGELVVMAEQERFSRNKRAINESPVDALRYCLEYAGIKAADLTAVALGLDVPYMAGLMGIEESRRSEVMNDDSPDRLMPAEVFGPERPKIIPVRHHLAHAWSAAAMVDPADECAVLVYDNRGEDVSTSLWHFTPKSQPKLLKAFSQDVSLGLYYRAGTLYSGLYGPGGDAGRFMGLAAYGRPTCDVPLVMSEAGPSFEGLEPGTGGYGPEPAQERTTALLESFRANCFPYSSDASGEAVFAYSDFAASVQASLERVIISLAEEARRVVACDTIALAGGVALNCTANGKLAGSGLFDKVAVQPAAHDAGTALGAALEVSARLSGYSRPWSMMRHAYWGPSASDSSIRGALDEDGIDYREYDDDELARVVAARLAEGATVGWFSGRAEVGPRALGARSLLGDPRSRTSFTRLNNIKRRELWRPLAPSVLAERFHEYFEGAPPNDYMIVAAQVRKDVRHLIPAVVHVDGSARPQAVRREDNLLYWRLIREFAALTGVPMVINTSFNREQEPVVNTAREAVRNFRERDIDVLMLNSYVADKALMP